MTVDDPAPPAEALWQKVEDYRPYLKAVTEKVLGQNDAAVGDLCRRAESGANGPRWRHSARR